MWGHSALTFLYRRDMVFSQCEVISTHFISRWRMRSAGAPPGLGAHGTDIQVLGSCYLEPTHICPPHATRECPWRGCVCVCV